MKHLITKLLLILAVVFGVSVAQAADFYLVGSANAVGNDSPAGWSLPGVHLTTDANGYVYFWAEGDFKISSINSDSWDNFDSGVMQFKAEGDSFSISYDKGNSNVGSGKKYVRISYDGNSLTAPGSYRIAVNDSPFEQEEKTFTKGDIIYFKPNESFLNHGNDKIATFKAVFNEDNKVFCTKIGNSGYYSFAVPSDGLTRVRIRRGDAVNTSTNSGTWYQNYTQWMQFEEGKNCIVMGDIQNNDWSKVPSSWDVYTNSYEPAYTYSIYHNFGSGNEWSDLQFADKDGVLTAEITFGEPLSVRRGCLVRRYKDGVVDSRYSAKSPENQLSLLNPESSVALWSSADGVENIQVPAGTVKVTFRLTLDGLEPTALSYVLEGQRTPDLWIGPGNPDGSGRTQIGITSGQYDIYEIDVTAGETFRFYSQASGGNWIGPEEGTDKTIPGNGETQHETAGNGNVYKFETAGHYLIRVLSFDGVNKVVFKAIREEIEIGVPKSMTLKMWKNTQAQLEPDNQVEMTYDEAAGRFVGVIPCGTFGGDHWLTIRLTSKDDNGKTASYAAEDNLYLSDASRKRDLRAYAGDVVAGNTTCNFYRAEGHAYDNWEGDVTVIADFSTATPTVSVYPCYYFIGDQNKWFSKEFDGDEYNRGINVEIRDKDKPGYEFLPEIGDDGNPTGWYVYTTLRLAGQFQIFDGSDWSTAHRYSHSVGIESHEDFEKYLSQPLIINSDVNTIRKSAGQNFNLPCNTVEDCQIRFNPDENQLEVSGTMKDYYIFYGREGDLERDENLPLRAHINSDKPNSNNYYLPFNNLTNDKGQVSFEAGNVRLPDGSYDTDHMNYTVGDDWNANGKIMVQLEFDENGKYVGGDQAFFDMFPYAEDVKTAYAKGELPNGMSLKNKKVWVAKVPNGFASPAGTHFAVAFRNSNDPNSYRDKDMEYPLWTPLGTRHLYFFDGIHMHVNNVSWASDCETEIAYRIYTYDIDYNNVVVDYITPVTDNSGNLYTLHKKADRGHRPENTTDDDQDAWIELSSVHQNCELWKSATRANCGCPVVNGAVMHDWRVADTEPDVTTSVTRNEIPAGLASARVQFRIRITPKASAARAAGSEPYTIYYPAAPTIGQNDDEVRLQGVDHYMVMDNGDGVWTAVRDILDENGFSFGEESDEAPVYYNLQGVRVEKPGKGIHIVVRGGKSEKVMF